MFGCVCLCLLSCLLFAWCLLYVDLLRVRCSLLVACCLVFDLLVVVCCLIIGGIRCLVFVVRCSWFVCL